MSERQPDPATIGTPRPKRGRPASLSRDQIAAAAVEVGFVDLTVTAVAERLGVSHAGLYTHVADRDDLVLAAADLVARRLPPPIDTDDWRAFLEHEAWILWDTFADHPGLLAAVDASGASPPSVVRRFAAACLRLHELGFAADLAVMAADTVYDLAVDSSSRSTAYTALTDETRGAMADTWSEPLCDDLAAVMRRAVLGPPRDWFAHKLAFVLDGIGASVGSVGGGSVH